MQSALSPAIPLARGGPISDQTLEQIIAVGTDAQINDRLSADNAALIMLTLPQLASELLNRRRAMDVIQDMTDMDNVTFLPGA